MLYLLLTAACCLAMLSTAISPAWAITGRVINRTLQRPQPEVVVSCFLQGNADGRVLRDTTDAEGRFAFPLPPDPEEESIPALVALYRGIGYPGEVLDGEIEISVYELSHADTAISIATHHILVHVPARDVTYILIPNNRSDRTYISEGDHPHGLEIELPPGVTSLLRAPRGVHLHGSTLVDPRPIMPGNSRTFFSFALPASNRFTQRISYPTAFLEVLVQPPEADVTLLGLQNEGVVTIGAETYRRFSAEDVIPGAQIELMLNQPPHFRRRNLVWVLAGLSLVFGIAAVLAARRAPRAAGLPDAAGRRRTALLEQIADLDRRFDQNAISEADYGVRRDVLLAEIAECSPGRGELLELIADLDDAFEQGRVSSTVYRNRRDSLKARIVALSEQRP